MLEHNLSAIRYKDYGSIAGAYPNDLETQQAVRSVSKRFPNVHLSLCRHDSPTSKADCLNWAFQHLLPVEEELGGERFEVIITHDAEDLIHPDELRWINYYSARLDFLQVPVLPLATPLTGPMRGIYCDEFAKNHMRDMTLRVRIGGLPSAGVGTGYSRGALENLGEHLVNSGYLTEDQVYHGLTLRKDCRGFESIPITWTLESRAPCQTAPPDSGKFCRSTCRKGAYFWRDQKSPATM